MKDEMRITKEEEEIINIFLPLYRSWKWIIVGAILAGVLALVLDLIKPQFSAKAIINIDRNALYSENLNIPSDSMVRDIGTSDYVLKTLIQELNNPNGFNSIESLRENMELEYSDFSLVLTITDEDPERAVILANMWAGVVGEQLRFSISPSENVIEAFKSNEQQSRLDWENAQEEFLIFQKQSEYNVLNNRLLALEQLLYRLTLAEGKLVQAQQDTRILVETLRKMDDTELSSQKEILLLLLTTNSLVSSNLNWSGSDSDSIQFDLNLNNQLDRLSADAQINDLQALEDSIDDRVVLLSALISDLEDEIRYVNDKVKSVIEEEARLSLNKEIAQNQYKKSKEELIGINVAKLHADESIWISSKAVEGFVSSLSPAVMFGIGFMLGGLGVVILIYGKELWMKLKELDNQ